MLHTFTWFSCRVTEPTHSFIRRNTHGNQAKTFSEARGEMLVTCTADDGKPPTILTERIESIRSKSWNAYFHRSIYVGRSGSLVRRTRAWVPRMAPPNAPQTCS